MCSGWDLRKLRARCNHVSLNLYTGSCLYLLFKFQWMKCLQGPRCFWNLFSAKRFVNLGRCFELPSTCTAGKSIFTRSGNCQNCQNRQKRYFTLINLTKEIFYADPHFALAVPLHGILQLSQQTKVFLKCSEFRVVFLWQTHQQF